MLPNKKPFKPSLTLLLYLTMFFFPRVLSSFLLPPPQPSSSLVLRKSYSLYTPLCCSVYFRKFLVCGGIDRKFHRKLWGKRMSSNINTIVDGGCFGDKKNPYNKRLCKNTFIPNLPFGQALMASQFFQWLYFYRADQSSVGREAGCFQNGHYQ